MSSLFLIFFSFLRMDSSKSDLSAFFRLHFHLDSCHFGWFQTCALRGFTFTKGGPSSFGDHDSCLLRESHRLASHGVHESYLVLCLLSLQWFVHRHIDVTTQSLTILVTHTKIDKSWQVRGVLKRWSVLGRGFVDVTRMSFFEDVTMDSSSPAL